MPGFHLWDVNAVFHGAVVGVELDHGRERHPKLPRAVVVDQHVAGTGKVVAHADFPLPDPLDVVGEENLLMPVGAGLAFVDRSRALACIVDARIAPTVQEVARVAGRQRDACLRIPRHECAAVIDDVGLAEGRVVDRDVVERLVVIQGVDVDPVAAGATGEIGIHLSGMLADHAVVGKLVVDILNQVVGDVPLPDHVAVHVDLHHAVGD